MDVVVVGLDVSDPAAAPLRWAAGYCGVMGDELVGVVGYQPSQAEVSPDWYEERVAEVRKQAERTMDFAAPAVPHRVDLRDGDPRDVIPDAACDHRAAVVVVGAPGAGGFHHLGLGSVAHHLARHLLVPLVAVPALGAPLEGSAVVVGLDGTPGDVTTLAWAVRLAEAAGGRVCAVYASDPDAMSYPHPPGATSADAAEAVVRAQVARAAAGGATIATTVEVEHPLTALIRVADEQDASVIVVGRKGAGHLRGLLLGRVPSELPFEAHRAVAVVPRAAAQ